MGSHGVMWRRKDPDQPFSFGKQSKEGPQGQSSGVGTGLQCNLRDRDAWESGWACSALTARATLWEASSLQTFSPTSARP